jgi:iron complex transport system substrate-binding protein
MLIMKLFLKVGSIRPLYFSFFFFIAFFACNSNNIAHQEDARFDYYPNKITLSYAKGFDVRYFKSYKIVDVMVDQDSTNIIQRYYLVEQGTKVPEMEEDAVMIRVPLASVSCLSTTQVAYLATLGYANNLSGVGYASFIQDSIVQSQLQKGWTQEITRADQLDKELVLQSNTTVLMANAFDELALASLEGLDIPVIFSTEYSENNVLARAEWIKFFALFFNAEKKANAYFNKVEEEYKQVQSVIDSIAYKPNVMFGSYYQGIWYVPGGESLIPSLFSDAGASYLYEDQHSTGNVPIDEESLIDRMSTIDQWGFIFSKQEEPVLADFLAHDQRLMKIAKAHNMKFFYCNSYYTDYFGMANLQPQILLKDLGKIFHPELFPEHQFVYFQSFK